MKLYIRLRARSFAQDILQNNKSKLKKSKVSRKDMQQCSKGNLNEKQ